MHAAPKPDLWPYWETHDASASLTVDHGRWDRFLDAYLDTGPSSGIYVMGYGSVTPEDRKELDRYIQSLERITVTALSRTEQMAYWVNLYNAATVQLILDHYPVDSIRDIRRPFDRKLLIVEGKELSLNDIEHRILRPIFRDNRIHYAVNCASLGCPNLQPLAYRANNLEELLQRAAREYIQHPRGMRIEGNVMTLSSIYTWFREDFGGSEEGVLEHLARYATPDMGDEIRAFSGRIRYRYDWSLNETGS
jgi:hypothetical protein